MKAREEQGILDLSDHSELAPSHSDLSLPHDPSVSLHHATHSAPTGLDGPVKPVWGPGAWDQRWLPWILEYLHIQNDTLRDPSLSMKFTCIS